MANAKNNPAAVSAAAAEPAAPAASKTATVIALLQRADGATLGDLVAATGWLPHTTRAALTGLRKKGHAIGKTKVDGVTTYNIASVA
jgi:hypothetical protein